MKVSESWTEEFEYGGHKLTASSNNAAIYITLKTGNLGANGETVVIAPEDFDSLLELLTDVRAHLGNADRWPPMKSKKAK